ncbi:hypothetical protein L2E82_08393 [Cichorium intybus]|uniref:Uncharacterized protein n=1 Tax=Cichorium intybus TaxID=13427 RepID=A0ACB9G5T5_CICIN|nr:hypothetical protein L2E82_08393 [Cichorium intybus]
MNISSDLQSSTSINPNHQYPEKISRKFEEITSTASKNRGWATFRDLYEYQGFWYYKGFLERTLFVQEQFKAQPTDIILCTTPESDAVRLHTLTFSIMNRTSSFESCNNHLHSQIPWLERDLFPMHKDSVSSYPKGPLFTTHIPYTSLPKSIIDSKCKIVYMCRNPKDVLVSQWRNLGTTDLDRISLNKAYGLFCKGVSNYGPFWDHVLGYWEATMKWPDRVLFVTYEKLETETSFNVRRLAEFLDRPFSLDEERRGVVRKISMKNTKEAKRNKDVEDQMDYLSKEMKDHIDQITKNRFKNSGLIIG